MKTEGSLPQSQQSVNYPYPEPRRSSQRTDPTFKESILIVSSYISLGLPSGSISSGFFTIRGTCVSHA